MWRASFSQRTWWILSLLAWEAYFWCCAISLFRSSKNRGAAWLLVGLLSFLFWNQHVLYNLISDIWVWFGSVKCWTCLFTAASAEVLSKNHSPTHICPLYSVSVQKATKEAPYPLATLLRKDWRRSYGGDGFSDLISCLQSADGGSWPSKSEVVSRNGTRACVCCMRLEFIMT